MMTFTNGTSSLTLYFSHPCEWVAVYDRDGHDTGHRFCICDRPDGAAVFLP